MMTKSGKNAAQENYGKEWYKLLFKLVAYI